MTLELCCYCGNPTGNAGKDDDSLYCEVCGEGPFCDRCYKRHMNFEGRERGLTV